MPEFTRGQREPNFLSAVTDAEIAKLQELAFGRIVLEIGSFTGFSASQLAKSAARVDCIDPFYDYFTKTVNNRTAKQFLDNTREFGNVFLHVGESKNVAPSLMPVFDMVFIDGDHVYDEVIQDLYIAFDKVHYGGVIALHDYHIDPPSNEVDVKKALLEWLDTNLTMPMRSLTDIRGFQLAVETAKKEGGEVPEPPAASWETHLPELPIVDSLTWFTVNWR